MDAYAVHGCVSQVNNLSETAEMRLGHLSSSKEYVGTRMKQLRFSLQVSVRVVHN